jgi:glycosyltransferase involved in cell wall biosynthesis
MNRNLVSVIMSVYREDISWLKQAVESILCQSHTELEFVIVLDDPENTELMDYLKGLQNKDSRVHFLINPENLGLVASLNRCLEVATGYYIARMDADDISHPNRLELQKQYLEDNDLDLIGSNIRLIKSDGEFLSDSNKILFHENLVKFMYYGASDLAHPTFFARRRVYEKLGGYNLSRHTEDAEFVLRAIINGFKLGNHPEYLLEYRYHEKSISKNNAMCAYFMLNYLKHLYRKALKTGNYNFDEKYCDTLQFTNEDVQRFNRKRLLLGEAQGFIAKRRYFSGLAALIKAFFYSYSVCSDVQISLIQKLLKRAERKALSSS